MTRPSGQTAHQYGHCGICDDVIVPGRHRIVLRSGAWCHVECAMAGHE